MGTLSSCRRKLSAGQEINLNLGLGPKKLTGGGKISLPVRQITPLLDIVPHLFGGHCQVKTILT